MWRFGLAAAFLSFFCIAPRLNAATTQQFTITKDPQAIAIAQKALAAMGGAQALLAYQDSVGTGTLTVYANGNSASYPITLKCKGTHETRVELQKPEGINLRIVNQGQGAIQRPDGTIKPLSMSNTIGERVNHIPLLSLLSEYQNSNISLAYQGTAQVNGQVTQVVVLSYIAVTDAVQGPLFASMTQTFFYVDQTSGLIDKIQYMTFDEGNHDNNQKIEVYLSNYQIVDGISLPFHQTSFAGGSLDSDLVLNSVAFNLGLADSDFTLPQ